MDMQDKILSAVLDNQEKLGVINTRLDKIENVQTNTYDKLNGFLHIIDRHEAEIAALRAKLERFEERLLVLEA
jgi:hypothetical protein